MYEFHGWINIVADDSDNPESAVLRARQEELIAALEARIQPLQHSPVMFVHIAHDLNGASHLLISGLRNHRDDRVVELYRWIAEHQRCSYGILHVRDDEASNGYDNAFVIHTIKRGSFSSRIDENLSPCIPELEPPWRKRE